jgi:hypothetical protein
VNERFPQMERVVGVRVALKRLREAEYGRAFAALAAANAAIARNHQAVVDTRASAQRGLSEGDRECWHVAERAVVFLEQHQPLLVQCRANAESGVERALDVMLSARVDAEQAERLRDAALEQVRADSERRSQAESDDRFAARRQWQRGQSLMHAQR